jgi:hypothetical protein
MPKVTRGNHPAAPRLRLASRSNGVSRNALHTSGNDELRSCDTSPGSSLPRPKSSSARRRTARMSCPSDHPPAHCGQPGTKCAAAGVLPPGSGRTPQLVADLKGNDRLAGACRWRQKDAPFALENGLHRPIDRDFLVVTRQLARNVIVRRKHSLRRLFVNALTCAKAPPQLIRRPKTPSGPPRARSGSRARRCRVRSWHTQTSVRGFGHIPSLAAAHRRGWSRLPSPPPLQSENPPIPQKVVRALLRPPFHFRAGNHDPVVGEALLLAYLLVRPAPGIELLQDVPATGIRFGEERH